MPGAYSSAGPSAIRVSNREYILRKADNGQIFCVKCLQHGHRHAQCVYFPACAICDGKELRHWTRHHDDWESRQNAGPIVSIQEKQ